jgi:hypothetical protein
VTAQDLPLFATVKPREPGGYVGRVLERLYQTNVNRPITPLDLHKHPDLYGTDCMRNLRHAKKWLEEKTEFTVTCETACKGKAYWKYWLALRSKA